MAFEQERVSEADLEINYSDDRVTRRNGTGRRRLNRDLEDPENPIDFKNIKLLQTYVTEHGKVIPSRITGNSPFAQRELTTAIKRARHLGLLGFVSSGR